MRLQRVFFAVSILALVLGIGAERTAAQVKIAVMDFQLALLETADMQKQAAALEARFKPRQDEMARLAAELQTIQTQMQSAAPADSQRLAAEGQRKQTEAQRLGEDLQSDVDFERDSILQKAALRMREVLTKLRTEKGLDLIVDVSTALSFNAAFDITKEATAAYDVAHPVQ